MARVEREAITGVWGGAPSGVQGQSPWSGGRGQDEGTFQKCKWGADLSVSVIL